MSRRWPSAGAQYTRLLQPGPVARELQSLQSVSRPLSTRWKQEEQEEQAMMEEAVAEEAVQGQAEEAGAVQGQAEQKAGTKEQLLVRMPATAACLSATSMRSIETAPGPDDAAGVGRRSER